MNMVGSTPRQRDQRATPAPARTPSGERATTPSSAARPLPQALIFDVDGTLADTEEAHRQSFNLAFEHAGLGWHWDRDTYRRLLAVTGGKERIAAHIDSLPLSEHERAPLRAAIPQWHADKTRRYAEMVTRGDVPLRPGIARLLDDARAAGVRLAIATTTTRANIDALLTAHFGSQGSRMFEIMVCGDQVAAKKPAPDVYLAVLRALGLEASQAIALEDSEGGLASAVAAGLWTVVTPTCWTQGGDFDAAGLVLGHLDEADAGTPMLRLLAGWWHDAGRSLSSPDAAPSEANENRGPLSGDPRPA